MSQLLRALQISTEEKKELPKQFGSITSFIDRNNIVVTTITGRSFSAIIPEKDEGSDLNYNIGDGVVVVNGVVVGKGKAKRRIAVYNV